jgi:hypothetical protein
MVSTPTEKFLYIRVFLEKEGITGRSNLQYSGLNFTPVFRRGWSRGPGAKKADM